MSETSAPQRRRFFSKLLNGDNTAPNRAPWHRVPEVNAGDGDVLWSGIVINNNLMVVGDEGMVLRYNGESDSNGRLWQPMEVPAQLPLHGIWGLTEDNIFAVGWMGTLLHYDGEQWQSLRGGVIDQRTERFAACEENTPLFAIDGNSQGRAWAVMVLSCTLTANTGNAKSATQTLTYVLYSVHQTIKFMPLALKVQC